MIGTILTLTYCRQLRNFARQTAPGSPKAGGPQTVRRARLQITDSSLKFIDAVNGPRGKATEPGP
jgi:hypothetical protein